MISRITSSCIVPSLVASAVLMLATPAQAVEPGCIQWDWSMGDISGYFITDGTLNPDGTAPAADYTIVDAAVTESLTDNDTINYYLEGTSLSGGDMSMWTSSYFTWDGSDDVGWGSTNPFRPELGTIIYAGLIGSFVFRADYWHYFSEYTFQHYAQQPGGDLVPHECGPQTAQEALELALTLVEQLNQLQATINAAVSSLERDKINTAINQLEAALNQISAQTGNQIDTDLADQLTDLILLAIDLLET